MDALRAKQRKYHQLHALSTVKDVFPRFKNRSAMQRFMGHSLLKAVLAADRAKLESLYQTKEIVGVLSADEVVGVGGEVFEGDGGEGFEGAEVCGGGR
jgi:hypothetical protein